METTRFLFLIPKLFRTCIKHKIVLSDVKSGRVNFCDLWTFSLFSNVESFLFLTTYVPNELYVFLENLTLIFGNKRGYAFKPTRLRERVTIEEFSSLMRITSSLILQVVQIV